MKAQEIYEALKAAYPQYADKKICDIYQPCKFPNARQCADVVSTLMLDFDNISDSHQKSNKASSIKSVDGMSYKSDTFVFIEHKGWLKFLEYQTVSQNSIDTETNGYELLGKLTESKKICEEILGDTNLFTDIPQCFILCTDIDTSVADPAAQLYANLMALSGTGNWWGNCNASAKKVLETSINDIDKYYTDCHHLDSVMAGI